MTKVNLNKGNETKLEFFQGTYIYSSKNMKVFQ